MFDMARRGAPPDDWVVRSGQAGVVGRPSYPCMRNP